MIMQSWKRVDRFALLSALFDLAQRPPGELLIVFGRDDAERSVAADVTEDFFRELGQEPVRVLQSAERANSSRDVLARAWRQVDDAGSLAEVPRSLGRSHFMEGGEIVNEIARQGSPRAGPPAPFIFDTVDSVQGLTRFDMSLFEDLARESKSHVVVFSRVESKSAFPRGIKRVKITDMPVGEIRMSLKTTADFAGLKADEIDALVDEMKELSTDGDVPAAEAYDVLQAGLRRLA